MNETDEYGYTGLHMAAENGHLEIVTMLLVGGVGWEGVTRYLWNVGTWWDVKGGGTRVGDETNFRSVTGKKMRNYGTLVECQCIVILFHTFQFCLFRFDTEGNLSPLLS